MDLTKTIEPRSDQLNFDDVTTKAITGTVQKVTKGSAEQPVEIHLEGFPGRPYKPGKSMRRVLVACWGPDASVYVGRRITLYGDPTIRFGKEAVGGIRISHLSHLPEPVTVSLTVTRGQRKPFTVQPLADDQTATLEQAIQRAESLDDLAFVWQAVTKAGLGKALTAAKDARKAELSVADEVDR